VHDLVDRILEQEQVVGGQDTTERFLRASAREIDRLNQLVLYLMGFISSADYNFEQKTEELKLFVQRSNSLKARPYRPHCSCDTPQSILSTIPDVIGDRPKFLAMIRDIASAIKDLLDSFNDAVAKNGAFFLVNAAVLL
jgi:hypothetical protein